MPDEQDHPSTHSDQAEHDPTGLELAQTVARSLAAQARRRRRANRPRPVAPQVSGARADDRDPTPLSDAVERLVESKGWTTEINVHTLLARWGLLVGVASAAHSTPEGYADTILTVRADSTAWAAQLRYLAPQLVAMLKEQPGDRTSTRMKTLCPHT